MNVATRVLLLSLAATMSSAESVIDFETLPGGSSVDGLAISDQYLTSHGVAFSLEDGSFPLLAEVGPPSTAFRGPPNSSGDDNPEIGVDVGSFFLTDDGVIEGDPTPLIIRYQEPTAIASGEVLDVDGRETFVIEARDAQDAVLEEVVVDFRDPGTGDGLASPWVFQRVESDIASIRIVGTTDNLRPFGLAFDNFNATAICSDTPVDSCVGAGKATLVIQERKAGKEKLKLKLSKLEAATVQGDFGDPVDGSTRFDLCLYDPVGVPLGGLSSVRAGEDCGKKQKPCWKKKRDRGWSFKDPDAASGGVKKLGAMGGAVGKGKLSLSAGNNAKKGQKALRQGLTGALDGLPSVRVQLLASDSGCFESLLSVEKSDPLYFKGKGS